MSKQILRKGGKFQKCKQGGGRVREHTWLFFRITDPEQGYLVPAWSMLPWYPWCFTEIPKPSSSHSLAFLTNLHGTEIVLGV